MPIIHRRIRALCAAALASLAASVTASLAVSLPAIAQTYPNKAVHIVVPFAAGGAVDIVARTLGDRLAIQLGQPVIVDNKPGAGANIGADFVAKSPADGYTLLLGANGLATNMTLYPKLPFDTLRDFAPVALVGNAPLVLVVASDSPFKTVQDLIAAGKKDKTALTYGSAGTGSSGHLASALLTSVGGFEALHIAYKGGAPALVDLIGGRISFMLLNPLEVMTHLQSGRLRALAVTGAQRIPLLPNVATVAESGVPGFEAGVWWALMAPANTPKDIVVRLNAETDKALAVPAVHDRLVSLGAVVTSGTPTQLASFLQSEITKWSKVIKAGNITAE